MNILEFDTLADAAFCLQAIDDLAATYWGTQGYDVIDGDNGKEVVGKKQSDTRSNFAAETTRSWAKIAQSPDGTYYFESPFANASYASSRLSLPALVYDYTERQFPASWQNNDA